MPTPNMTTDRQGAAYAPATTPDPGSPWPALLAGIAAVGVLDILDAFIFLGLRNGATPERILQGIASGLLGRAAFSGGMATAALGLALHFVVASGVVLVYYAAAHRIRLLVQRPFLAGALYGPVVWAVMNYVVIPLSATGGRGGPRPLPALANGLLIHVFGVGIPAALAVRAAMARRRPSEAGTAPR